MVDHLEDDELDSDKHAVVQELFIDTADDNYVTARWCYSEYLFTDFLWLAVHALEKYFKAILLLNGTSAREYGHDITKLYLVVQGIAGDLFPKVLTKPEKVVRSHWYEESPSAYLGRLLQNGDANNRYLLYGFSQQDEDLYKLDRMVFSARRICVRLDNYYLSKFNRNFRDQKSENTDFTTREFLSQNPNYWEKVAGGRLADVINGSRGERLQYVTLNHNLPFAPKEFKHGRLRTPSASHNPILWRHILEPLSRDYPLDQKEAARELRDWIVQNIWLPRDVVKELMTVEGSNDPKPSP